MHTNIVAIGHDPGPSLMMAPPAWLAGRTAVIFPRLRARGRPRWILRVERERPPVPDTLMGWAGGDDPLASEVELTFLSREAAADYCERNGLEYRIAAPQCDRKPARAEHRSRREERLADAGAAILLSSLGPVYGRCELRGLPDVERALIAPAAVFALPEDVVRHPLLTYDCKREILLRWAHDEYLKEVAEAEGMTGGEDSRLDEVKAALIALGEPRRPSPAAPAMFVAAVADEAIRLEAVSGEPALALAA